MNPARLTLWGNADSVNVQKVMWCCEETGLPTMRSCASLAARDAYRNVVMAPLQ